MRVGFTWLTSSRQLSRIMALAGLSAVAFGATPEFRLGPLPLIFEPNKGQVRPEFAFVGRAGANTVYLNSSGMTFRPRVREAAPVTMRFLGGNIAARVEGLEKQPGVSNYYRGSNPANWLTGISQYNKVRFGTVYRGIDVVYYGTEGKIEYDLVVAPGADPDAIRLQFDGASQVSVSDAGDLVVGVGESRVFMQKPVIYQTRGGTRVAVPGRYVLSARNQVRFRVGDYDKNRPVVIDPTIVFSQVIGGNSSGNFANGVASDAAGNVFLAGYTNSIDFPVRNSATAPIGGADAFVVKINTSTTPPTVAFSTLISGGGDEFAFSIAVDNAGNAAITGQTNSPNFPLVTPYQATRNGASDAFFVKLNGTSGALLASTYYGGSGADQGNSIATDGTNFYIGGSTTSADLPSAGVAPGGPADGFVVKFSSTGALGGAKYVGGSGVDAVNGIAVDASGRIIVGGVTTSSLFNGESLGGVPSAGFITRLTAAFVVDFSMLVGGGFDDVVTAVGSDSTGAMYGAGATRNSNLPGDHLGSAYGGGVDAFIIKLSTTGTPVYSRYVGGSRTDGFQGMAVKGDGTVLAAGSTLSADVPILNALQTTLSGDSAPVVTSLNAGASWTAASNGILGSRSTLGAGVSPEPGTGNVIAATDAGLFRSIDSGVSWTPTLPNIPVQVLSRSPSSPQKIYAAAQMSTGATATTEIYASSNGGGLWTAVASMPGTVVALAVDAVNPSILYAATSSNGLFKSSNGGITWTPVNSLDRPEIPDVVADPVNAGVLYVAAAGEGVFRSTNAGATWALGSGSISGISALAISHVANTILLYALGSGQVYVSTDAGLNWTLTGFPASGAISIVASRTTPSTVFVGTAGGDVWRGTNVGSQGESWTKQTSPVQGAASLPIALLAIDDNSRLWASVVLRRDGLVTKLDSAGTVAYTTYLGGNGSDIAAAPAFHATSGDALIAGGTNSADFPLTAAGTGFKSRVNPATDAFVARIKDATDSCTFTVSPAAGIASGAGGTLSFAVTAPSDCPLPNPAAPGWIHVLNSGSGTGTVGIRVDPNVGTSRSADLVFDAGSAGNFTVNQAAASCAYSLSSHVLLLLSTGSSINLATDPGCPWSVETPVPNWFTAFSPTSGTGPATINFTAARNNSNQQRSAFVTIAGQGLQILQPASFANACAYSISTSFLQAPAAGTNGSFNVTAGNGGGTTTCPWTPTAPAWITVNSPAGPAVGSGTVTFSVTPNTSSVPRTGTITVGNQSFTVDQRAVVVPSVALRFVPLPPCRIADTRLPNGPRGGPLVSGGSTRTFAVDGVCGVPVGAKAYSLNVTVVPQESIGFMTVYPGSEGRPLASTMNSLDSRVKASAVIVGSGSNGSVSVYSTGTTDVILDINGYFVPATDPTALAFYPLEPCRIADTRLPDGTYGGPAFPAAGSRTYPIRGRCGVPPTAEAYSLNFTAVPSGYLGYLSTYPTGAQRPLVSTLNAFTGTITANAAIVPAGTGGAIDVYASNPTHLVIDIDGYFAPPSTGGLSLYTVPPCRVLDTRLPAGSPPINGQKDVDFAGSGCGVPLGAQAVTVNATIVPASALGFLTLWPQGASRPLASTLNAIDQAITSNMAIVPTSNGNTSAYSSSATHLILDVFGYLAP